MPVLVESPASSLLDFPARKRWTRGELRRLIDEGHHEYERYELFAGELLAKMPKKRPHVKISHKTEAALDDGFGREFVQREAPINLRPQDRESYNPEPDLVVLSKEVDSFDPDDPGPDEILLIVEISDSTLQFDRASKASAYALANIFEYWIVDVEGRRIIVHRGAGGDRYTSVASYSIGESVAPLSKPNLSIPVASLFQ